MRASSGFFFLFVALLAACGGEGQSESIVADANALRTIVNEDPAPDRIAEVEEVADAHPVRGAELLANGVIDAARRQVQRIGSAQVSTREGRRWKERLHRAYAKRLEGLNEWHRYLNDAATDDARLLLATMKMREAELMLIDVHSDMDTAVPLSPSLSETDVPATEE